MEFYKKFGEFPVDKSHSFASSADKQQKLRKKRLQDHYTAVEPPKRKATGYDENLMPILRRFEEEHTMLQRRLDHSELEMAKLKNTVDFLMTQVQCSRILNPVTMTNSVSNCLSQQPQVINAVSMAPVVASSIMATPQTQIITNTGAPLTIAAAATSQGQQITVQNTAFSTAGQQLAQPLSLQITPAAQVLPSISGASMGLALNTSTALAISNASPMMTVMTHSILPH